MGDIFVCQSGRILWWVGTKKEKSKTGFVSEKAMYRCESCEGCPYKRNITTELGRRLRMNRSIQVEGAFGVLKQDYSFRSFLCSGKTNIKTEILLLGLAYNIKKLSAKISGDRLDISLFELKTA